VRLSAPTKQKPIDMAADLESSNPNQCGTRMDGAKIFNLSLHRSATESFSKFMADHGFKATHWPGPTFDRLCQEAVAHRDTNAVFRFAAETIEKHDVFADVPYCFLYRELFHAYPDASYLIVLRPLHLWVESVRRHIGSRELHNLEKLQYGLYFDAPYNYISDYTNAQLEAVYVRHLKSVVNLVQHHNVRFRLFELDSESLEQKGLITELSEYLNFQIRAPFPTINVARHRLGA
jgi:hypothetical protein